MLNEIVFNYIKNYDILKIKDSENEEFLAQQKNLCLYHYHQNKYYKKIIDDIFSFESIKNIDESINNIPYLPVDLFKKYDLYSTNLENIFKILRSSGTTGNKPSKIFLDRENANSQTLSLSKIFTEFTGLNRPTMLIADCKDTIKNKKSLSARGAGIIGFSYLCRKPIFALNSEMNLILRSIENLVSDEKNKNILLFGFTYIIWLHMLKIKLPNELRLELSKKAVLVHGGGWKKLKINNISKDQFKSKVEECLGIKKIINYYGMIEQTGSIFMECEKGWLHSNPLCTVIARDQKTLKKLNPREIGIAQVISSIPTSYPGNSLLTDDLISIGGIDDCNCGRKGVYFDILGRLKASDPRGCSDTYRHKG
mgnify:CR=1 FL=1|tara:strand:- start:11645 stop:12745 length:1101 start_codon:yes stop_codon:yes gene_type:complete